MEFKLFLLLKIGARDFAMNLRGKITFTTERLANASGSETQVAVSTVT